MLITLFYHTQHQIHKNLEDSKFTLLLVTPLKDVVNSISTLDNVLSYDQVWLLMVTPKSKNDLLHQ